MQDLSFFSSLSFCLSFFLFSFLCVCMCVCVEGGGWGVGGGGVYICAVTNRQAVYRLTVMTYYGAIS